MQELQSSSVVAEAHLQSLERDSLEETEKKVTVYRASKPLLPNSTFNHEELHKNHAKRPWPRPAVQWTRRHKYNIFILRQIQDKSARSYDWMGVLRLLKAHYRPASVRSRGHENRSPDESANSEPRRATDTISEPEHWTKATFDRYVYDLIKTPRPAQSFSEAQKVKRRQKRPCTVNGIGSTLYRLFNRKDMSHFVDSEICNAAIVFLSRHAMLARARSIFLVMEDLSISIPVSTFNIFMRAAAHQKDLHTLSLLLDTMIIRGSNPDAETWAIFVQCLDSIATRRLVIAEMATLGILHQPGIMTKVVISTVKDDLIDHLAAMRDPRDFFDEMKLKYGPCWMSSRTGNVILREICKRVSLSAGLDLIEPLRQHGFVPHAFTLKTFFLQALMTGRDSLPLATFILEAFSTRYSVHVNRQLWAPFFFRARALGYLNVARVLWIAACLRGNVTRPMRVSVLASLQPSARYYGYYSAAKYAPRNPELYPQPSYRLLRCYMGNFLLGLDPFKPASWNEGLQAMRRCLRMAYTAKLRFSLTFNLLEAYKVDREWKSGNAKDLGVMLQYRYPVLREVHGLRPGVDHSVKPHRSSRDVAAVAGRPKAAGIKR